MDVFSFASLYLPLVAQQDRSGVIKYRSGVNKIIIPNEPILFTNHIDSKPMVAKLGDSGSILLPRSSLKYMSSVSHISKAAIYMRML